MAANVEAMEIMVPDVPAIHENFISYAAANPDKPMKDIVEPYRQYDAELRKIFAQQPDHPAAQRHNIVPVFNGNEKNVRIRARNLDVESGKEKESYIMPLNSERRMKDDSPAITQSLKEFQTNFSVFSESSLVDLDWSNVVVAGSAVVTSLLAVPEKYQESKKSLREYYHEKVAPASDVDLFLYGLTEAQAMDKLKQIEKQVREALLVESSVVRTKNAITIVSEYPVRHVQIVLRIYKSVSEILTGFDVDCSCAAYDGSQVYASPRALAAYMTQINTVDLTRRSPSYENRLSKYAHRGFEIYWPNLERDRIDPTIFERSFRRTEGLARLLVLEKLPRSEDRDAYTDQRRAERGRPPIIRYGMQRNQFNGDMKALHEEEVADWADFSDVSDYHTITIPYGPRIRARKIEKMLFTKDVLLNAEWNKPENREVDLHRHPAFFGTLKDVISDCCGYCPKPSTIEEEGVVEKEDKIYVRGELTFMKDDPGRQAIGSFNPITADDWTDMAYVGNTERLCQAIIDCDLQYVSYWLQQDGNDPNTRDYTGRTPLHLAASFSTVEVVQSLIDNGARMIARLADGKTALHLAAMRGSVEIVSALLRKSEANEEENEAKVDASRSARQAEKQSETRKDDAAMDTSADETQPYDDEEGSDVDMVDDASSDTDMDATTEQSIVNVKSVQGQDDEITAVESADNEDDPDIYDVNVVAWDIAVTPLHLAIIQGHTDVVKCLVQEFGADVLLPIKLYYHHGDKSPRDAILNLVLASQLSQAEAEKMTKTLIDLGASVAQADLHQSTALRVCAVERPDLLEMLNAADKTGVRRAINHLVVTGNEYDPEVESILMTMLKAKNPEPILRLLKDGAKVEIDFVAFLKAYSTRFSGLKDSKLNKQLFQRNVEQPVTLAVLNELPRVAQYLLENFNIDANLTTTLGYTLLTLPYRRRWSGEGTTLLDEVQAKLKQYRAWPEEKTLTPPKVLRDDSEYLSPYPNGSYSRWAAKTQLERAKKDYARELERHEKDVENQKKARLGLENKREAINEAIEQYEVLEKLLLSRGAKSYYELYPEVEKPDNQDKNQDNDKSKDKDRFNVNLQFERHGLDDEEVDRYIKLFEAAWMGDTETVKQLTLVPWRRSESEEHDTEAPSAAGIRDTQGLTPFAVAVLRGHNDLARTIMEIVFAQFEQSSKVRGAVLSVGGVVEKADDDDEDEKDYEEDEEDDGDDDDDNEDIDIDEDEDDEEERKRIAKLAARVADPAFTIENVGEISLKVQYASRPINVLEQNCPVEDFINDDNDNTSNDPLKGLKYLAPRSKHFDATADTGRNVTREKVSRLPETRNLFEYAIGTENMELLTFLLDLRKKCWQQKKASEGDQFESFPRGVFLYALQADKAQFASELVKKVGAGFSISQLVTMAHIEINIKPKFYQGLTVHGRKRRDWAARAGNPDRAGLTSNSEPPLLEAAHMGRLNCVKWAMSEDARADAKQFALNNSDDIRIKKLLETPEQFESLIDRYMSTQSDLALHCCIMGDERDSRTELLQHLISVRPSAINKKSRTGYTPLQIAFSLLRLNAAKILINAGADQTCREGRGKNLIHSLLNTSCEKPKETERFRAMLDLIDKSLLPAMFSERAAGSLTPLAYLLDESAHTDEAESIFRLLLQYGSKKELEAINGEGETPLHVAVKLKKPGIVQIILEHNSALLNRENSIGRTPFEFSEDARIGDICEGKTPMPPNPGHGGGDFWYRRALRFGISQELGNNLVERDPRSFDENFPRTPKPDDEKVYDLLQEARKKLIIDQSSKRRLVTLHEANEVARRLAAKETRGTFVGVGAATGPVDEVDKWLSQATQTLNLD